MDQRTRATARSHRRCQESRASQRFDPAADYDEYVDGKPRYDGVRSFLASRGIELPQGSPSDPPEAETIDGLGNRKNELVQRTIPGARRGRVSAPGEDWATCAG
jgi:hypothetical protein